MKLTKLFLVIQLLTMLKSQCSKGCLSCNGNDKCLLCDFTLGYAYRNFQCVKIEIENCKVFDLNGHCLSCSGHNFLDKNNNKCLAVDAANKAEDCTNYSDIQKCQSCSNDKYPINGQCVNVNQGNLIQNCTAYQGPQTCATCAAGYLPNYLGKSCIANQTLDNCLLFSNVRCKECPANYKQSNDYYRILLQLAIENATLTSIKVDQENEVASQLLSAMDTYYQEGALVQDNCLKHQVDQCAKHSDFNVCQECQSGYFLKDNKCIAFPKESVPNCRIYLGFDTCIECINNYFLRSSSECASVNKIDNCAFYDGKANETICTRCESTHYLDKAANRCVTRQNTGINNCEEYQLEKDECAKCQIFGGITYTITDDGLKCLPEVPNCKVHNSSNSSTTDLTCQQCIDEYYYNSSQSKCERGSVSLCRVYSTASNQPNLCVECMQGYYLKTDENNNQICVAHTEVQFCASYNNKTIDQCEQCDSNSFLLDKKTECLKANIEGCQTLTSINECSQCRDGFNKVGTKCEPLATSTFCKRAVDGVCSECLPSNVLKNGICHPPFEFETSHCQEISLGQGEVYFYNSGDCKTCQKGTVPYNQKNHFVCVSNQQLETFYHKDFYVPYCASYKVSGQNLVCHSCIKDYYLYDDSGTMKCKQECAANEVPYSNYLTKSADGQVKFSKNRICISNLLGRNTDAKYYGQNKDLATTTFFRLDLYQNKVFWQYFTKGKDYLLVAPENLPHNNPVSKEIYQIIRNDDTPKNRNLLTKEIENCEFYADTHEGQNACVGCHFGYFGLIKNWNVEYCHEYQASKCKQCIHSYVPSTNGLTCEKITGHLGCERFDYVQKKCLQCYDKYYLDSDDVCKAYVNQEHCRHLSRFQDKCLSCHDGYYLASNHKCYKKVENCQNHKLSETQSYCKLCEPNYSVDTAGKCHHVEGYCWFEENNLNTNSCLLYDNVLKITQYTECRPKKELHYECAIFDGQTCIHCNPGHYMIEGFCCSFEKHPNLPGDKTVDCTQSPINNCREYEYVSSTFKCKECNQGFHLTSEKQCCPEGKFWNTDSSSCEVYLNYTGTNQYNCMLFSADKQKCEFCKSGYVLSHGKCCTEGQYNNSGTCSSITTVTGCLWLNDSDACIKCPVSQELNQAGTSCVAINTSYDNTRCDKYDVKNGCQKCPPNTADPHTYYVQENNQKLCCIQEKNEYYDSSGDKTCKTVGSVVANCIQYDKDQNCVLCDQAGNFYLAASNKCCSVDTIYDGSNCVTAPAFYENCRVTLFNKTTDFCEKCLENFTFYSGTTKCIPDEDHNILRDQEDNTGNVVNSDAFCKEKEWSASASQQVCKTCKDGYLVVNDGKNCCIQGTKWDGSACVASPDLSNCFFYDSKDMKCANFSSLTFASNSGEEKFIDTLHTDRGACATNLQWDGSNTYISPFVLSTAGECCTRNKQGGLANCDTNITIANCLIEYSGACKECLPDYYLDGSDCKSIENCAKFDWINKVCLVCKDGFRRHSDTSDLDCINTAPDNAIPERFSNCSVFNSAISVASGDHDCHSCKLGYYLASYTAQGNVTTKYCCRKGFYYDGYNCKKIEEKYCSEGSLSNSGVFTCNSCFYEEDQCYSRDQLFWEFQHSRYSLAQNKQDVMLSTSYDSRYQAFLDRNNQFYKSSTNKCCPKGQYFNTQNKNCQPIVVTQNCWESNDGETCSKCQPGFESTNNKCEKKTSCGAGEYQSNGVCCPKGEYFDQEELICIPILDPFCEEADDYNKCKTCASNMTPNSNSGVLIEFHFQNHQGICGNRKYSLSYEPCVSLKQKEDAGKKRYLDYQTAYSFLPYCANWKTDTFECETCITNSFVAKDGTDWKNLCCPYGHMEVDGRCESIEKFQELVVDNCDDVNLKERKCNQCARGYHLQQGYCCAEGQYLDQFSRECKYKMDNCKKFDNYTGKCLSCPNGFYLTQEHCCKLGQFWDSTNEECKFFSTQGFENCLKGEEGVCYKCSDLDLFAQGSNIPDIVYNYNGYCIAQTTFLNSVINGITQTSFDNTFLSITQVYPTHEGLFQYYFCDQFDNNFNCSSCIEGYNLYKLKVGSVKTICCQDGYYPNNTDSPTDCESRATGVEAFDKIIDHCTHFEHNGSDWVCSSCADGTYLTNGHCCDNHFYWNTDAKRCTRVYQLYSNMCLRMGDDGNCAKCVAGSYKQVDQDTRTVVCVWEKYYYDYDKKIFDLISGLALTNAAECQQVHGNSNAGTKYKCFKCNQDELLNTSNQCEEKAAYGFINNNTCRTFLPGTISGASVNVCTACIEGHYQSYPERVCCPEGKYFDPNDAFDPNAEYTCKNTSLIGLGPVKRVYFNPDKTVKYFECKDNTILNEAGNACIAYNPSGSNANNCNIAKTAGLPACHLCQFGYYLGAGDSCFQMSDSANTNLFLITPNYSNCSGADVNGNCKLCQNGFYLTNGKCCKDGEFFDSQLSICVPMGKNIKHQHCLRMDNGECTECDIFNDFFSVSQDNRCCPKKNYLFQDTNSNKLCREFSDNTTHQQDCNFTKTVGATTECRNQTELEISLIGYRDLCGTGTNYLTKKHCCANSEKWDGSDCISSSPCEKVDEEDSCLQCESGFNGYLTNGSCCASGNYTKTKGGACEAISSVDSDCDEMQFNKDTGRFECTKCNSIYNHNEDYSECCLGKYLKAGVCTVLPDNCIRMQNDTDCQQCAHGYYNSNGNCCLQGHFWDKDSNGGECRAIPKDLHCEEIAESKVDNKFFCSKCNHMPQASKLSNGVCCPANQFHFTNSILAGVNIQCVKREHIQQCIAVDQNFDCQKCNHGILLDGICCQDGNFLNVEYGEYACLSNTIDNCLKQKSHNQCEECAPGFHLDPTKFACCPIGHIFSGGVCSEEVYEEHCSKFDADGQCTECASGFYWSQTSDGNHKKCCENQSQLFWNSTTQKAECYHWGMLQQNCGVFNAKTLLCESCLENYQRFGDSPICCEFHKDKQTYFDKKQNQCVDIEQQWCLKLDGEKCTQCDLNVEGVPLYISNNHCCPERRYWSDEEKQCVPGDSRLCKRYEDESNSHCAACLDTDNHYLTNKHCCPHFHYWSNKYQKCIQFIDYCKFYEEGDEAKCKQCGVGFSLSLDQKNCCQNYTYIDTDESWCIPNNQVNVVYEGCNSWDKSTLLCTGCLSNHYLQTNNLITRCCPNWFSLANGDQDCTVIDQSTYPNCTQLNNANNKCVTCETGYLLNGSGECKEIPTNCLNYNPNTELCTLCKKEFYLSENHCCGEETKWNGTDDCAAPVSPITNCLKYEDTTAKCLMCKDTHYVSKDKSMCVTKGSYRNGVGTEAAGNVSHCERYDDEDGDDCLQCFPQHSLQTIKENITANLDESLDEAAINGTATGSKKFCYRTNLEHCVDSFFYVSSNENALACRTCEHDYYPKSLSSQPQYYHRHPILDDNCLFTYTRYLYEDSSYQCAVCKDTHYLDISDHTCKPRTTAFTDNCVKNDPREDKCLQCNEDYSLTFDFKCRAKDSSCLIYDNSNPAQCLLCNDANYYSHLDLNAHPGFNCELISDFASENDLANPPDFTKGYINECNHHHQCSDHFMRNVSIDYQNYFSCHRCQDETRIPFISLSIQSNGNINSLKRYSFFNGSGVAMNVFQKDKENKQSECFKADFSEFNYNGTNNFPANCGLAAVNADHPINTSQSNFTTGSFNYINATVICLDCKPSYKPASRYSFMNMVTSCVKINNCKSGVNGSTFNECDTCNDGYYFPYDTSKGGIDRTECFQSAENHDVNCYVFNKTTKKCKVCKNGFSLNYDDVCERLSTSFCETFQNRDQQFGENEYLLAQYRGEQGCTKCLDKYQRLYQDSNQIVCVASNYLNALNTTTNYIEHCEYYKNKLGTSDQLYCFQCKTNYIIQNETTCIPVSVNHGNCTAATSATECSACKSGYYLVNNRCVEGNIAFCQVHKNGTSSLQCDSCQDGYYLTSDYKCEQGTLNFCKVYQQGGVCTECQKNYQLIRLKDDVRYCLPLGDLDNDCEIHSSGDIQQKFLTCTQCKQDYFLDTIPEKNVCAKFQLIQECIQYDKQTTFQTSTLNCLKCSTEYYLSNNQCLARTNLVDRCQQFEIDKDECKYCQENFYLSDNKLECVRNPGGIAGCAVYQDENNCLRCRNTYYLEANECKQLPTDKVVDNCVEYNSLQQCLGCISGYSFEENKCNLNNVANCLEFEASNSCRVCQDGFGLSTDSNNINTCVTIPILTGCLEYSQLTPYGCTKCDSTHMLIDAKCEAVGSNNLIAQCLEYNNSKLCVKCQQGYALALDLKSCILIKQKVSCQVLEETETNFCDICQPGFKLDTEGKCVEGDEASLVECWATQYNDKTKCGVCKFGYYMNVEFVCLPSVESDTGKEQPVPQIPNNTSRATPLLIKLLTMIFLTIF